MDPKLFVNDGSFLERFKQIQKDKEDKSDMPQNSSSGSASFVTYTPKTVVSKTTIQMKGTSSHKPNQTSSSGKLAFSLKQKSKLATPAVKFGEDEDDYDKDAANSSDGSVKRQKLGQLDASDRSSKPVDVAPPPPSDPTVRKVAEKLASFVAKNGRQFEHVTRQKNPGDTPFKFLFDESCSDYKYYEYRLSEEEKALSQVRDVEKTQSGTATPSSTTNSQKSRHHHSKYQTPASALYEPTENAGYSDAYSQTTSGGSGEASAPTGSDPIAMMEYYMKKAAQEEKRRPLRHSNDEMPPPAYLQDAASGKKGHHMGDYIPPEELEKFLATCNDAAARKNAIEQAEKAKIQADNVGHRLLSKMGWREGEGLGSSKSGISTPIMAGDVKKDNLGVGALAPGEVTPDDDIYEQYKKRMMLGYKYRPNPLNNPRKQYY